MKASSRSSRFGIPAVLLIALAAIAVAADPSHSKKVASLSATSPSIDASLAAIQALTIDHGTITLAQRDESPTFVTPDNKTMNHLPPRTVVKLLLQPAKGSNIHVELWLPDAAKWNGRLLGFGNGGAAGKINPAGLAGAAAGGWAAVTTDMGTAPNSDSGIHNPDVWKDFGYRATHLMTVVAKQIITAYYGRPAEYAYFSGGSTGGQQAMQESQRYPDDYDGIVATIAAHCRTPLHAYFLWNHQILEKCPFTPEEEKSVIETGREYMASREVPAAAGKFVSDPRCDAKDIEAVIALAMKNDSTLTPQHADALRKLLDGPHREGTGERIFDGIPIGAAFDAAKWNLYLFNWVFGKDKKLSDINFGKDIDTYTAALGPYLNAENPDLSAFAARGGKLILLVGSADECVPYHTSIEYYEKVITHFGGSGGGLERVQSFFKFYIVPGMAHGGGPGIQHFPDLVAAVKAWRENGTPPGTLDGKRIVDGKVELEMPIYPYPLKTGWDDAAKQYIPIEGPRGGIGQVADRFLPAAAE